MGPASRTYAPPLWLPFFIFGKAAAEH